MGKITFNESDNPVILGSTNTGINISGCYSRNGLHLLAKASELDVGTISEDGQTTWFNRVRDMIRQSTGVTIGNSSYETILQEGSSGGSGGYINLLKAKTDGFKVAMIAGSSGATLTIPSGFQDEWWTIYNYLAYGHAVKIALHNGIGFTGQLGPYGTTGGTAIVTSPTGTGAAIFIGNTAFETIFQITQTGATNGWNGATWTAPTSVNDVISLTEVLRLSETPVLGVLNVGITGGLTDAAHIGIPADSTHLVFMEGRKKHTNDITPSEPLLTTHLSPDLAGIITNCEFWKSPGGVDRGQVLDVALLENTLSDAQEILLDNKEVNYCRAINGLGVALLNDTTSADEEIRVIRVIDKIKSRLIPYAYAVLFEVNDINTRNTFINSATGVLNNMVSIGAIIEPYNITCDTTNNTTETIADGKFIADIVVRFGILIRSIQITVTKGNIEPGGS